MVEDVHLELEPYGAGTVALYLQITLPDPDGFRVELTEFGDDPNFHILATADDHLVVQYLAFGAAALVSAGQLFQVQPLSCMSICSQTVVRAWLWLNELCNVEVLIERCAKGAIILDLPRGSVVRKRQIWGDPRE